MRLKNILALTDGTVINEPFVTIFTNIVFEANRVTRGDLFVGFNESDIEEAILNGAYGVIFDKPTQISDSEIAWIKVNDISQALKRLLRFRLIEKEVVAYKCDEIVLKLALQILIEKRFIVVTGDIITTTKLLWDVEHKSIVLFSPTETSEDIFSDFNTLLPSFTSTITIMEQTLFETSFIHDNIFYERQLISPFFIPYLEELLYLLNLLKINFRLKKFTPIENFEAVFTNKKFEIKEFGTSDTVLIFEKNCTIVKHEILYLQKQAPWAKTIFLIPYIHTNNFDHIDDIILYQNENEILNILKKNDFHFALIVGVDKSILTKPLVNQAQISLFDFN